MFPPMPGTTSSPQLSQMLLGPMLVLYLASTAQYAGHWFSIQQASSVQGLIFHGELSSETVQKLWHIVVSDKERQVKLQSSLLGEQKLLAIKNVFIHLMTVLAFNKWMWMKRWTQRSGND